MTRPPTAIANTRVLCWSLIDQRHRPTGKCRHVVDGESLGPVAGIVICHAEREEAYHLLYCDSQWNTLTDTWHATLEEAKRQAEFEYEGVSKTWSKA